jgi:hypothetical protein
MGKQLHVISFDNPFPPNYGGVIDVYYKLKALFEAGVEINLHVFEYGRERSTELSKICKTVNYYPRRTFVNPFVGALPYIVSTRNDVSLLQNLLKDEAPILFEGLHSCYFLNEPLLANRLKIVRMHNIEHDYYRKLEEVESNFFKKYFFAKEADRLTRFEEILNHANHILAISPNDVAALKSRYKNVSLLPAFHANQEVTSKTGKGKFIFYHGNLSVGENDEAARFLVNEVFNDLTVPFIIAGNNPSAALKKAVINYSHITLKQHASTAEITQLTQDAHVNILPTFQSTGIKLKLINVLYQGRWCVVNNLMVENTGLADLCAIANSAKNMKTELKRLMDLPFQEASLTHRKEILTNAFCNQTNAKILIGLM